MLATMGSNRQSLRRPVAAATILLLLLEAGCIWRRLDQGPNLAPGPGVTQVVAVLPDDAQHLPEVMVFGVALAEGGEGPGELAQGAGFLGPWPPSC